MKSRYAIATAVLAMGLGFAGGFEVSHLRDKAAERRIATANEERITELNDRFNRQIAERTQIEQKLAASCAMEGFVPQQFTLLYEPGDAATSASEPAGLALLDALKPGLGKAIARLQSQPGAAPMPPNVALRWVLYRQPGTETIRAVIKPAGGELIVSTALPEITQ